MPNVLLVEDDARLNGIIKGILEDLGLCVLSASSFEAATDLLAESQVGWLVTDIMLNGENGGEHIVRGAIERNGGVKVVIVSGYPPPDWLESGMTYLRKPFTVAQLTHALRV